MALIKCKECNAQISSEAKACPHCGAKVKKPSGCLKWGGIIFAIMVIASLLGKAPETQETALNQEPDQNDKKLARAKKELETALLNAGLNWDYVQSTDDLTGKPIYFATTRSTKGIELKFPYSGLQFAELTARTHPRYGKSAYVALKKGQINCNSYDGCNIKIVFDGGKVYTYKGNTASDGSTNIIFIENYSGFMGKLLKAKEARISLSFYQDGSRTLIFNVANFDVSKYRPK